LQEGGFKKERRLKLNRREFRDPNMVAAGFRGKPGQGKGDEKGVG